MIRYSFPLFVLKSIPTYTWNNSKIKTRILIWQHLTLKVKKLPNLKKQNFSRDNFCIKTFLCVIFPFGILTWWLQGLTLSSIAEWEELCIGSASLVEKMMISKELQILFKPCVKTFTFLAFSVITSCNHVKNKEKW